MNAVQMSKIPNSARSFTWQETFLARAVVANGPCAQLYGMATTVDIFQFDILICFKMVSLLIVGDVTTQFAQEFNIL